MTSLDRPRAEAFAGQLLGVLNHSMLGLMISIGHRTGLFDAMAGLAPSSSAEIARAAGLDERYVREWLAAMVTGRLVEYDGKRAVYQLPAEHAASLTRAAGKDNLAMLAQYLSVFGAVEDPVVDCFARGGGVPYSAFTRFQRLQAEESAMHLDAHLLSGILPLVAGLESRLAAGIAVLDIGCGAGHALNLMAQAFPRSRFTGIDLSEEGLAMARAEAARLRLDNIAFELVDAARLDRPASHDLVAAFDSIHDQVAPAVVLGNARRALRPGGSFLCMDIAASSHLADNLDHPLAPALYAISAMHCMTVSLAGGGAGLGAMWGEERAREMILASGFVELEVRRVDGDLLHNYYIARVPG